MKRTQLIILLGSFLTIVSFQNCSNGDFAIDTEELGKSQQTSTQDDFIVDSLPVGPQMPDDRDDSDRDKESPIVQMPPVSEPPIVEMPPVQEVPPTDIMPPQIPPVVVMPPDTQNPPISEDDGDDDSENTIPSDEELRVLCKTKHQLKLEILPNDAEIDGLKGNNEFLIQNVNHIKRSGNLTLVGQVMNTKATIALMMKIHGHTLVCNSNIIRVEDLSGNLIVVGGNITSLSHSNGNIRIVDGKLINPAIEMKGNLVVNGEKIK